MRLTTARDGPSVVVRLAGRLDGEGADQLSEALDGLLRDGVRAVLLDTEDVSYVSSAGTQALARAQQEFGTLRAELRVRYASPAVVNALTQTELRDRFLPDPEGRLEATAVDTGTYRTPRVASTTWGKPLSQTYNGSYDVTARQADASVACRLVGSPERLSHLPVAPGSLKSVAFAEDTFGLGIGALGPPGDDAVARLGEIIAAGGAAVHLPTDGGRVPDFQLSAGGQVPVASLATGFQCQGPFSHLLRYSTLPDRDAVPLAELARVCLEVTGGRVAGIVMLAEVRGLVGAWLLQSPGGSANTMAFQLPTVRKWFGFAPQRILPDTTALVVGLVALSPEPPLAEFLRPIGTASTVHGHFHAVAMTYRPVPQRTVALAPVLSKLLRQQRIRGVLHLIADDRRASAGQSEFRRGLLWTSAVGDIESPP